MRLGWNLSCNFACSSMKVDEAHEGTEPAFVSFLVSLWHSQPSARF